MFSVNISKNGRHKLGNIVQILCIVQLILSFVILILGWYCIDHINWRRKLLRQGGSLLVGIALACIGVYSAIVHTGSYKIIVDSAHVETRGRWGPVICPLVIGFLILFIIQICVGFATKNMAETKIFLQENLKASMPDYKHDTEIKSLVDKLQTDSKCCGANGFSDWGQIEWTHGSIIAVLDSNEDIINEKQPTAAHGGDGADSDYTYEVIEIPQDAHYEPRETNYEPQWSPPVYDYPNAGPANPAPMQYQYQYAQEIPAPPPMQNQYQPFIYPQEIPDPALMQHQYQPFIYPQETPAPIQRQKRSAVEKRSLDLKTRHRRDALGAIEDLKGVPGKKFQAVPWSCCNMSYTGPCIHDFTLQAEESDDKAWDTSSLYLVGCVDALFRELTMFSQWTSMILFISAAVELIVIICSRYLETSLRSLALIGIEDGTAPGYLFMIGSPSFPDPSVSWKAESYDEREPPEDPMEDPGRSTRFMSALDRKRKRWHKRLRRLKPPTEYAI